MPRRKNLNDTIHGDRASIRGGTIKTDDGFTDKLFPTSNKVFGGSLPDDYKPSVYKTGSSHFGERCYKSHPPLTLPGTSLQIFGGSCHDPAVKDAEIYIGFDSGMRFTERHWPWKKGREIKFDIPDMGVPRSLTDFKKLIDYTRKMLEEGRMVHCGCIGGHGRTGTFFAALVASYGEKDAITYVRENYCKKAVESTQQVNWLHDHFGITKIAGYKDRSRVSSSSHALPLTSRMQPQSFKPLPTNGSIFGPPVASE